MAEPDAPPKRGSGMNLTKKVGPLPVWAWALIGLAVGYYLVHKHYSSSTAATSTTPATDTSSTTPIPVGDQSGGGSGSASGSTGTTTPTDGALKTPTPGGLQFIGENSGSGLLGGGGVPAPPRGGQEGTITMGPNPPERTIRAV